MRIHLLWLANLLILLALPFHPLHASYAASNAWQLAIGAGALVNPAFKGAKDYQLSLLPYARLHYGDIFFASMHEGIGTNLINNQHWKAGPIVRYRFGREEGKGTSPFHVAGDDTNALNGLGDINGTFEPGIFIEYQSRPFGFDIELRKGIGGHKGLIVDLSMGYSIMLPIYDKRLMLTVSPRTTIVSDNVNDTYYSVDLGQSIRSGLPQFQAQGGLQSYGIGATGIIRLTPQWTSILFAGVDRLSNDAANAPLVALRGSETQLTVGLFLAYQFDL